MTTCDCRGSEHIVCRPKWRVPMARTVLTSPKRLTMAAAMAQGLMVTPHVEHVFSRCSDARVSTRIVWSHRHLCLCGAKDSEECGGSQSRAPVWVRVPVEVAS